jgi:hypothetical protein
VVSAAAGAEHEPPVDDRDTQEALGVSWRPVEETFADMVAWMHAGGVAQSETCRGCGGAGAGGDVRVSAAGTVRLGLGLAHGSHPGARR